MPGALPALDAEWSLLRTACIANSNRDQKQRLRDLSRGPIRWKLLFDLADRHGVQPLLHQALAGVDEVPIEERRALTQSFHANLHKALFLSRELIRVVDHLSTIGIRVLPYKGLALAETIYGDIALRQSGDIDLLIRPHDLPRLRDAVRDLGYTPHTSFSDIEERAYLQTGYECAFDGLAGRNLLEAQWAIQPRFYAVDFDLEGLFERAVDIRVAGRSMQTPCNEDLFVVLSLHAAKHVWGRLIWLCDLSRIMSLPTLNWDQIATQAEKLGVVRILRITLLLINRLLDMTTPAAAEASLPKDSDARELAEKIQAQITSDIAYDVESVAYFRLMLRLREQRTHRMRFLYRLVFTPGPGEWNAVKLPRPLFPLYRLIRLTRLAARFVGA